MNHTLQDSGHERACDGTLGEGEALAENDELGETAEEDARVLEIATR